MTAVSVNTGAVSEGTEPPGTDAAALVLTLAQTLIDNGEDTTATILAANRLSQYLGLHSTLTPGWDTLELRDGGDQVRVVSVAPYPVNMTRVIGTQQALQPVLAGQLPASALPAALAKAATAPPISPGLFALACGVGAGALSIINGAVHPWALLIVVLSAGVGGALRQALGRSGAGPFAQVLTASALAGLIGAAAVRWGVSTDMRLAALGPLLVMVPGPTILNGSIDLAELRLPLGGARLGYGLLTLLLIGTGALFGLSLGGTDLPALPAGHSVPLWLDVLCAGVAAACYGVFYSMPLRLLVYPVLVGALAHALRWVVTTQVHLGVAAGAGLACLLAGIVLVPICRRQHLPFAAVGFASVVSMVPGIFLFRMGGGLLDLQYQGTAAPASLLAAVLADGTIALVTVLAMALGLLLPLRLYGAFRRHRAPGPAR